MKQCIITRYIIPSLKRVN